MCTPPLSRSGKGDLPNDSSATTRSTSSTQAPNCGDKKVKAAPESNATRRRTISLPTFFIVLVVSVWVCFTAGQKSRVYFLRREAYGWTNNKAEAHDLTSLDIHQENWDVEEPGPAVEGACNMSDCLTDPGEDEEAVCEETSCVKRYARHMVADIQHVETHFLNSQERLIEAMRASAAVSKTKLVSHYCFSMEPMGVSCAGELEEEGRITFHTWPTEGVITMDFLTFSKRAPLPHPDEVKKIFGPPKGNEDPKIVWFIRSRGQPRSEVTNTNDLLSLFGDQTVGKTEVVSVQTPFQRIDIYDVKGNPNDSFSMSKKIRKRLPDKEPTERIVYLDGVMQSRQFGEVSYHEALVHPALLLHRNPKRVAIIGGGEGGTLREVLKHKTLEKTVMIDIDELMVNVSKTYIPQWSDCSNIVGSRASCFDDPRAEVYFEDAVAWFVSQFGDHAEIPAEDKFDVIIMDALDPSDDVEFSDFLYKNDNLLNAFSNALDVDGVLVAQVGQAPSLRNQPESYSDGNQTAEFIRAVERSGFENIVTYEESHARFTAPWSFLVAMKKDFDRSRWYAETADWELEIKKRISSTKNGEPSLNFFDSATMMGYQYPTRVTEMIWCLDKPDECEEAKPRFDPEVTDIPISSFSIKQSSIPNSGRGVFTEQFIPEGSYLGANDCVHGMFVPPETLKLIDEMEESMKGHEYWQCLALGYIDGYGWTEDFYAQPAAGVDSGILTFMNHGCDGSYNSGISLPFTETSFEDEDEPPSYSDYVDGYNPYYERRYSYPDCSSSAALRDVHAGEEMLCNYLVFEGSFSPEEGRETLETIRRLCTGDQLGRVTDYENRKKHSEAEERG